MPDSPMLAILVAALGAVAWWMIRRWATSWETRLTAQDDRLDKHDVNIAVLKANLEHIRTTGDETRADVKVLLQQSNGRRTTG